MQYVLNPSTKKKFNFHRGKALLRFKVWLALKGNAEIVTT